MMPRVRDNGNGEYLIAKPLVHKAIVSIISGIIVIAGYMIVWAVNDASWKAKQEARIELVLGEIDQGILDRADERVRVLEEWKRDHEKEHH